MSVPALTCTIVSCPSCGETYELPGGHGAADGSIIRCSGCGHSWLEARAVEVIENLPAVVEEEDAVDLDREAMRIAEAATRLAARRSAARTRRRAALRGWALLAAAVAAPLGVATAFPERVVRAAPATALLYAKAGIEINIRGLEIRNARSQLTTVDDTKVLAVKGEIVNVSSSPAKVPSMRFALRDGSKSEVYSWTLASVGGRTLEPGQATSFVTRIAEPPEGSQDVEIRFARAEEITVNAGP